MDKLDQIYDIRGLTGSQVALINIMTKQFKDLTPLIINMEGESEFDERMMTDTDALIQATEFIHEE